MIKIMLLTLVVFGLAMLIMAVGVICRHVPIRGGGCGGSSRLIGPDGQSITCDHCTCQPKQNTNKTMNEHD